MIEFSNTSNILKEIAGLVQLGKLKSKFEEIRVDGFDSSEPIRGALSRIKERRVLTFDEKNTLSYIHIHIRI